MPNEDTRRAVRSLVVGASPARTRRAVALAGALCAATASLRALAPGSALHDCCHAYVFAVLEPFALSNAGLVALPFATAGVTMVGLAAIHAAANEGYVPSILLAAAPTFGLYAVNGPGVAPVWAAALVLPTALQYGTVGYLLGLAARRARGRTPLRAVARTFTN